MGRQAGFGIGRGPRRFRTNPEPVARRGPIRSGLVPAGDDRPGDRRHRHLRRPRKTHRSDRERARARWQSALVVAAERVVGHARASDLLALAPSTAAARGRRALCSAPEPAAAAEASRARSSLADAFGHARRRKPGSGNLRQRRPTSPRCVCAPARTTRAGFCVRSAAGKPSLKREIELRALTSAAARFCRADIRFVDALREHMARRRRPVDRCSAAPRAKPAAPTGGTRTQHVVGRRWPDDRRSAQKRVVPACRRPDRGGSGAVGTHADPKCDL